MEHDDRPNRTLEFRRDVRAIRRCLTFIALAIVVAAFYFAKELFLPLTLAVVLTLVLRPVSRGLSRLGLPAAVGAGVIVLGLVAATGSTLYLASEPASRWLDEAPRIGWQIQFKFRSLLQSASAIGEVSEQVQDIAEGPTDSGVQEVVVREPGLISRAASGGVNLMAGLILCTVVLYFLLATADMFLEKLVRLLPRLRDKVRAVRIAQQIESEISRYLFTVTTVNICLGVCIAGGMAIAGLPNAFLWGGMATLLNFIPYLGAFVGAGVVFAVSAVTFAAPVDILLPPLIYLSLTTIEGQFVTPTVLGRRFDMNPVAILLGVAFWGWLWGVAGAVMAAPLLLVLKIAADHIERWSPLSAFLSVKPEGTQPARSHPKADARTN